MVTTVTTKMLALLMLGFKEDENPNIEDINKAWKRMCFIYHSDHGGSDVTFRASVMARDYLLENIQPVVSRQVFAPPPSPTPREEPRRSYYTPPPTPEPEYNKKPAGYTDIPW